MVADYYTKPLQGKAFYTLRDIIMDNSDTFTVKECVESARKDEFKKVNANKKIVTRNNANEEEKPNGQSDDNAMEVSNI